MQGVGNNNPVQLQAKPVSEAVVDPQSQSEDHMLEVKSVSEAAVETQSQSEGHMLEQHALEMGRQLLAEEQQARSQAAAKKAKRQRQKAKKQKQQEQQLQQSSQDTQQQASVCEVHPPSALGSQSAVHDNRAHGCISTALQGVPTMALASEASTFANKLSPHANLLQCPITKVRSADWLGVGAMHLPFCESDLTRLLRIQECISNASTSAATAYVCSKLKLQKSL